jgi:hypothetical protein
MPETDKIEAALKDYDKLLQREMHEAVSERRYDTVREICVKLEDIEPAFTQLRGLQRETLVLAPPPSPAENEEEHVRLADEVRVLARKLEVHFEYRDSGKKYFLRMPGVSRGKAYSSGTDAMKLLQAFKHFKKRDIAWLSRVKAENLDAVRNMIPNWYRAEVLGYTDKKKRGTQFRDAASSLDARIAMIRAYWDYQNDKVVSA